MRYISLNDVTERLLLEAAVVRESISNLAGTQPSALYGYGLPAPNQLKHKTLSNGLIDFLVGIC